MVRTFSGILSFLSTLVLLSFLVACSKPRPSGQPQAPTQLKAEIPAATSTAEPPAQNIKPEIVVANFVSGDVQARKLSSWDTVETGASLEKYESVKTGVQSECELQFGRTAVVRIREKTVIELKTIAMTAAKSRIALGLDRGAVLCKVRKLAKDESFRVQTDSAVCGVRGTEFLVGVSGDKTTVIAVKEGVVAILPASADVTAAEQAADEGVTAVDDMLDTLQASAPVVKDGQQIPYTPQAAANSSTILLGMGEVVQKIVEESHNNQPVAAQTRQQTNQFIEKAASALLGGAGKPIPISAQNVLLMKPLDTMEIRETPQSSAAPLTPQSQKSLVTPPALPLQPIESRITASSRALVGSVIASGQIFVAADASGLLVATSRKGRVLWTIQTANSPNENSSPVVAGGNVYFTGAKEFVIAGLATGAVLSRTPLDSTSAHLFGQRVLVAPPLGLFPTRTSLRVFDPASGQPTREIEIPGGSLMTPTLADEKILTVSQSGVLLVVDATSGSIDAQISTGATQPVALSVSLLGQRAFFADRKGLVVAVDLGSKEMLWSTPLPAGGTAGVFQDLEVSEVGVYAFARNTLFALSVAEGKPLFEPIPEVTTPPLLSGGKLYIGSAQQKLLVLDPATGKTIVTLAIGAKLTTRLTAEGSRIIAGTDDGRIFVIDTSAVK